MLACTAAGEPARPAQLTALLVDHPSAGVPPRWQLLKSRLEAICPSGTDSLQQLWRWRAVPKEQQPFLLQVRGAGWSLGAHVICARCLEQGGTCQLCGLPWNTHHLDMQPTCLPPSLPCPQVAGYDRQGMLHSLSHALWESDTTVRAGPLRAWMLELSGLHR